MPYRCRKCGCEDVGWVRRVVTIEATIDYSLDSDGGDNCTDVGCCVNPDGDHTVPSYDEHDSIADHHVEWQPSCCWRVASDLGDLVEWYDEDEDGDEDLPESAPADDGLTDAQRAVRERRRAKGLA